MNKLSAVLFAAAASGAVATANAAPLMLAADDLDGVEMDVLDAGETPGDMLNRIELPPLPDAARAPSKPSAARPGIKDALPGSRLDAIGEARGNGADAAPAAAEQAREAAGERGRAVADEARGNRSNPPDRPDVPDRPTPPDRPGRP